MKRYIITYTFRDMTRNFMDFYDAIKENVEDYRHIMESAWIVKTDKTAKELRDALMPFMTFKDHCCDFLFVGELGDDCDGMIAKSYWEFFKDDSKEDKEKVG